MTEPDLQLAQQPQPAPAASTASPGGSGSAERPAERCPDCGSVLPLFLSRHYCGNCGWRRPTSPPPPPPRLCPICGGRCR